MAKGKKQNNNNTTQWGTPFPYANIYKIFFFLNVK